MPTGDEQFDGAIPSIYERLFVPIFMEPYATDLAQRVARETPGAVLELACGTGVVTRELARLCDGVIVATDLNPDMLEQAESTGTETEVEWRQADALALPFPDSVFDTVVCQFGVMFFPDRPAGFAEARRVLKPNGAFIFNAWDALGSNEFAATVHDSVASLYPDNPPGFLFRTPYSYNDREQIAVDLAVAGFDQTPDIDAVERRSRASSPEEVAIALVEGTPLATELGPERVDRAKMRATKAAENRFGPRNLDARMQALVVSVRR